MSYLAKEIMDPDPPYCLPDTPVEEIIRRFSDERLDGMVVVDREDHLCGLITESDLIEGQANLHVPTAIAIFDMVLPLGEERFERELQRLQALQARDLMVEKVTTVSPEDTLETIAEIMSEAHIHHLPVVEDGVILGMVSRHEVVRALAEGRSC